MRGNVALTGGAALAAGLLIGVIVDRLARVGSNVALREVAPPVGNRRATPQQPRREEVRDVDVLELYRAAAAV
ncbi:MAG TPA: hypothetical protein VIY96_12380 [Thermoanaerobaculia bacterium]